MAKQNTMGEIVQLINELNEITGRSKVPGYTPVSTNLGVIKALQNLKQDIPPRKVTEGYVAVNVGEKILTTEELRTGADEVVKRIREVLIQHQREMHERSLERNSVAFTWAQEQVYKATAEHELAKANILHNEAARKVQRDIAAVNALKSIEVMFATWDGGTMCSIIMETLKKAKQKPQ